MKILQVSHGFPPKENAGVELYTFDLSKALTQVGHDVSVFCRGEDPDLVALIHLANCMALITGIGGGSDGLYYEGDPEIMKQFRLREKDVEKCIGQLNDRLQVVESWLEVA